MLYGLRLLAESGLRWKFTPFLLYLIMITTVFIVMVILSHQRFALEHRHMVVNQLDGSTTLMGSHPLQSDIATVVSLLASLRSSGVAPFFSWRGQEYHLKGWTEYLTKFLPFLVRIHLSRVPIVE